MEQAFFRYAKYSLGLGGLSMGIGMYCLTVYTSETEMAALMEFFWFAFTAVLFLTGIVLGSVISRLHDWVYKDSLTHVGNRKYFSAAMARALRKKQLTQERLCVAFVDLDDFKKINDCYGHYAGDRVLQHVAEVMAEHVRKGDAVARFGGDEFAILFPAARLNEARCILEKIRGVIARSGYVTISAGVIEVTADATLPRIFEQADETLYRAKREKNSIRTMETG